MNVSVSDMNRKKLINILLGVAALLSIPFIVMQFTEEVSWQAGDFLVMGVLLTVALLGCDFAVRKVKSTRYRFFIYFAVLLLFLLVWAELAVGIFGTPFAGS